jgi:hypothetical protein
MRTKGLNGKQYFMILIDDYTRMIAVSFIKINKRHLKI